MLNEKCIRSVMDEPDRGTRLDLECVGQQVGILGMPLTPSRECWMSAPEDPRCVGKHSDATRNGGVADERRSRSSRKVLMVAFGIERALTYQDGKLASAVLVQVRRR